MPSPSPSPSPSPKLSSSTRHIFVLVIVAICLLLTIIVPIVVLRSSNDSAGVARVRALLPEPLRTWSTPPAARKPVVASAPSASPAASASALTSASVPAHDSKPAPSSLEQLGITADAALSAARAAAQAAFATNASTAAAATATATAPAPASTNTKTEQDAQKPPLHPPPSQPTQPQKLIEDTPSASPFVRQIKSEAEANVLVSKESAAGSIVMVYSQYCGACKTFKPRFDDAATAAHTKGVATTFARINMHSTKATSLISALQIRGLPSLIQVTPAGVASLVPGYASMLTAEALVGIAEKLSVQ